MAQYVLNRFEIPDYSIVSIYTRAELELHRQDGTLIPYLKDLLDVYGASVPRPELLGKVLDGNARLSRNVNYWKIESSVNSLLEIHDEHLVWGLHENGMLQKRDFPLQYTRPLSRSAKRMRELRGLTVGKFEDDADFVRSRFSKTTANMIRAVINKL